MFKPYSSQFSFSKKSHRFLFKQDCVRSPDDRGSFSRKDIQDVLAELAEIDTADEVIHPPKAA